MTDVVLLQEPDIGGVEARIREWLKEGYVLRGHVLHGYHPNIGVGVDTKQGTSFFYCTMIRED